MRTLADALMATGQSLSDDKLILYILDDLSAEYESVIVNLTSHENLTIQEVLFILQNQEMRLDQLNSTFNLELQLLNAFAHFAATKRPNIGFNQPYSGHRGGHNCGHGRGAGRGSCGNFDHRNKLICQVCGKAGHVAVKCYHHFDLSYIKVQIQAPAPIFHRIQDLRIKPSLLVLLVLIVVLGTWIVGLLII
ncbi:Zinc finger, CCHC-type [Trema orientale]|uniref:Zinc finger, CCHC-type n=1 Tax=Trema orientale TaxID=63057 RepID=A0A2P5D6X2_TREOI|nr:Zinc finger, CCHC-type [Trema orientale]